MRIATLLAATILTAASATAEGRYESLAGDVNLLIANDLGRNGAHLQRPIAALMGDIAEEVDAEAVLALGDTHHYLGIQSVDDPLWMTNYELVYSHPELQIEWLPVLGNHEYRGNTGAVIDYSGKSRRWTMADRYYSKVFVNDDTKIKVVFIDTAPIIDKYRADTTDYPDAARQNLESQLAWLDKELSDRENADWLIVAGHHPVYAHTDKSASERGDMQSRIAPLLRKHKVDMYVCGHIHNFQHIREKASDTDYIVNSSGSLSRKKVGPVNESGKLAAAGNANPYTVFCDGREGLSILAATPTTLNLHMVDSDGSVIHSVTRCK